MCDKLLQCFIIPIMKSTGKDAGAVSGLCLKKENEVDVNKKGAVSFISFEVPGSGADSKLFSIIVAREPLCYEKPLFFFETTLDP
jgi:hypothetical protein